MERDFLRTLAEHAKSIMREEDLKTRLTMVRNFCGMVEEEMQSFIGMMKGAAFVNECQIRGNRNDVRAAFSKEMRQITQRLEDWVKDYNERPNIRNFSKDTFVIPTIRERCNSYVVLVFCMNFRKFEKSVDKNRFKRANGRFFFEECYKLAMAVSNYVKLEYFVKPATRRHMRETIVEHTRSKAPGKPMGDVKTKAFKTKREVEACEDLRYCMITDLFYLLTLYAATRNECEFLETEAELRGEPQPVEEQKAEEKEKKKEENGRKYSKELLKLFNWHEELLESLVGLSDGEIAGRIKQLAKERDKFGKPLIESPGNYGNKSAYAKALKENELIKCGAETFRRLL